MKKNRKFLLSVIIMTPILVTTVALSAINKKNNYTELSKSGTTIAMYVQEDGGEYIISSEGKFPTDGYILNTERSVCQNGSVLSQDNNTKAISLKVSAQDSCSLYFEKEKVLSSEDVVTTLGITVISGTPTFANAATTDEGVFSMEDDYGISYYYRGAVTNNYVNFANAWWRIIRINGDGSIRMIYDGTQAFNNGTSNAARSALQSVKFNTNYNDAKYVGYMYGPEGTIASTSYAQATTNTESSTIKTEIDNWYKTNIVDAGYSSYVSDEIFCNDRSTPGLSATGMNIDTGKGFGTNVTAYGATSRVGGLWKGNATQPTFICTNKNDAFTVSDVSKGNGALTYPIGLITADEIVAAGSGIYNTTNTSYYLYKGHWYWSLTPCSMYAYGSAMVFGISSVLGYNNVHTQVAVSPVINLSPKTVANLKGTGTMTDPYTVS